MQKNKYFIVLICIVISGFSYSQNALIDSVKNELKNTKEDTVRLNILLWLCENILDDNEWPKYNDLAYELSLKLVNHNNKIVKLRSKKAIADVFNNRGYLEGYKGNHEKATEFYEKSIKIREEIGDDRGIGTTYNNIGFLYYNKGKILQALDFFGRGLSINKRIGDKKGMAQNLNNIGTVYIVYGNIDKALECYQKSLKLEEEMGDQKGIANSLNSIGYIYASQGDDEKSLEYYFKSLEIEEKINDKKGITLTLTNIGSVYSKQKNIDKALPYFEKSLKINEEIGNKSGMANTLINLGACYHVKRNFEKALESYLESIAIYKEIKEQQGLAESYINIANLYLQQNKAALAKQFASNSLVISKDLGFVEKIRNAERLLSKADSAGRDYKGAFEHYKLFVVYRDSIRNETTRKSSVKSQFQIEFDHKEREINLKTEAEKKLIKQKSDDERKQKNIIIYSVLFGLLVVIVFSGFLFKSLNRNKRASKIISLQKAEVEQSKKEIIDSINYAKRIQYALLASENLLKNNLPEYFVLFQPKDVVSGDFYWATPTPEGFVYVTADCTGHGVPGAFMSLLNISKLSQAINENKITRPDLILNNVRSEITKALNPEGTKEESKDGMDAVLCKLNFKKMQLEYAAANNSFYIIRSNQILNCKADKMPVGKGHDDSLLFTYNEITLQKGDIIYTFTDGFADQFGGPKGKKFKYKQLETILLKVHQEPMQKQKEILAQEFLNWKGNLEQVDDMLVMGIKIS